ncbi:hypothetical protein B0T25DRAFT_576544 [Lasiosphaeria hispida]|uniref:Uncharacterized protein n=1 Tax=Lasiosphaeria hispida TaxID=260671 RepID=A0AAJ0HX72_9PEZI|nr:hypothetical protein B0T25DRAFT_576544 [Lasiosphaeria hispida]
MQTHLQLRSDVNELKSDVNELKSNVNELKSHVNVNELKTGFKELKTGFKELKTGFNQLKINFSQMRVSQYEMRVSQCIPERNGIPAANGGPYTQQQPQESILPFSSAIPIPGPNNSIAQPDSAKFPRHANEFYGLRKENDRSSRRHYDIAQDPSESGRETQLDPEFVVAMLDDILGLQEDDFTPFRERAQLLASAPAPVAMERGQVSTSNLACPAGS